MTLENEIAVKVFETVPSIVRSLRAEIKNSIQEVSFPQFRVLSNIHRGLSHIGEIAEHHGISQPSVSKMVDILVEKGLVKKNRSKRDARNYDLQLTDKGRTLLLAGRNKAHKGISKKIRHLSKADKEKILEALSILDTYYLKGGEG